MPRRRLHGETQKRRRKPRTRLLKRSETPVRVQATQQPAPFERAPQVEREDLEFLEAMRELDVQRSPWRGDAPARRQAVERVQFLAEDGEQALFLRSMAHLGVQPLQGAPAPAEPSAAQPACPPAIPERIETRAPPAAVADVPASPAAPSNGAARNGRGTLEPPPTGAGVEFAESEDAQAVMEDLLRAEGFEPGLKFAGATAPPRTRPARRNGGPAEDLEPDDELDLHGKTQEEAIRMVQGFLLTSAKRRLRHVIIVTGRGLNSGAGGPVLKEAVRRWLELNGPRYVRNVVQAPARHGGAGAFWLTLR